TRVAAQGLSSKPPRSHAWSINIGSPCWITNPTPRVPEVFCRGRRRDEIVNAASLAASCDITILMSGNWLALMGSQRWSCDAGGCNCSGKNQLRDICHDPYSASGYALFETRLVDQDFDHNQT